MSLVERADRDGVAVLTLNRPEARGRAQQDAAIYICRRAVARRPTLSPALFVELRGHVDALARATATVGCVVLRGAGRSFSAGNDLKAIQAGETPPDPAYQALTIERLEGLPQPVIGAVQGHCYTGALELVLACDLIVAADDAKFADTHGKWAMTPAWGMSQRLPRRVGAARAKEIMFTGRAVGGAEAAAIGLANVCVPAAELADRTMALAAQIVASYWHTLRADKMLVRGGDGMALAEGLRF